MKYKRIILITIDALRADHVGRISGKHGLTPKIDALTENSLVFKKCFSNGPGTNQSFPSILTSSYFMNHDGFYLSKKYYSLALAIKNSGYRTVAFNSNPFLSKKFGWNSGFDEYFDFLESLKSPSSFITKHQENKILDIIIKKIGTIIVDNKYFKIEKMLHRIYYKYSHLNIPYLEGLQLNKKIYDWINANKDRPFFLWMHYMDSHYPYIPPDEFRNSFTSRKKAFEFNISVDIQNPSLENVKILHELYKGEIKYVDYCIGELVNFLKEYNLSDNTLIILTSDHGEAFYEHKIYGHKYNTLYNEVIHVPLMIMGLNSKTYYHPVNLLDLAPTILDILEIDIPETFIGKSLLQKDNEFISPIFSESAKPDLINLSYDFDQYVVSCILGKWKLIINKLLDTVELFNIEHDFKEKRNLIKEKPELYRNLKRLLLLHMNARAYE